MEGSKNKEVAFILGSLDRQAFFELEFELSTFLMNQTIVPIWSKLVDRIWKKDLIFIIIFY
jgi:hypothetical protein